MNMNFPLDQSTQKMLEDAVTVLHSEHHTCVALRTDLRYTSDLRGVAPILLKLDNDIDYFRGAVVADKVIGKSAAMLLILGGATAIHADVISEHAIQILEEHGIPYDYAERVPYIVNRTGDGMCPMEKSVLEVSSPLKAYEVLKETYKTLNSHRPQ